MGSVTLLRGLDSLLLGFLPLPFFPVNATTPTEALSVDADLKLPFRAVLILPFSFCAPFDNFGLSRLFSSTVVAKPNKF